MRQHPALNSSSDEGEIAIAIKGGPTFSLYGFNDLGITSDAWDTKGVAKGNGNAEPGLPNFSIYVKRGDGGDNPTIPEPAAMAGLLAVGAGMVASRRKRA
ncbi:MAG: PEP-CTERM sorting domain-containing protein [Leptolyngbyaceae cyanobacterium]